MATYQIQTNFRVHKKYDACTAQEAIQKFWNEFDILDIIRHPNAATTAFRQCRTAAGELFYVMETEEVKCDL